MTEAYKIGITVAMTNLVSAELNKIGSLLFSTELKAKGLQSTLLTLGKIGVGAGIVAVGAVLAAGVEEARKFQLEAAKFDQLGFGEGINHQAAEFAAGMKTMGTSATENMMLVTDAMAVFKNLDHAEMVAPLMAKMKFANHALYGDQGGGRDSKFMDMLKVIEFRGGLKSDEEFAKQANYVQQVMNGSRNRVDASALLLALKTCGVALSRRDNAAFYLGSEPLIQEFGGSRYGTGAMSAYQNLVMLRTTQKALSEYMRLGLLDPKMVEMNSFTGGVKSAKPGAMKGASILESEGELAFLEKVLLPAFAKKGITGDEAIIEELGTIFTNRTASSLFARIYQQRNQLHTQIEANKNANNIDQSVTEADKTLDGKIVELQAQWKRLMNQMGILLPWVIKFTDFLIDIVKALQLDSNFSAKVGGSVNSVIDGANSALHTIGDWIHGQPIGDAMKSVFGNSAVPPPKKQTVNLQSTINLDGRAIANSTTSYLVDGLQSMPASGPSFDSRMSPMPVH
jgi:hypothetical protein